MKKADMVNKNMVNQGERLFFGNICGMIPGCNMEAADRLTQDM